MSVARESGHHPPIRDVVHRKRDREKEIHHRKQSDETPSVNRYVEQCDYHARRERGAYELPRLVLAPFGACVFNDTAHNRVVESVEYSCRNDDNRDCGKLRHVEMLCEHAKRQKIAVEKVVEKISSDCAYRKHQQIAKRQFVA